MAWLGLVVKSRRRLLLGLVLVLAAVDGIWWANRAHRGERQEYELGATTLAIAVGDARALPLFDEKRGDWTLDGKRLAAPVEQAGGAASAPDGLAYVVVRLPDDAGQTTFRHALLSLIAHGRCMAGIATGTANRPDGSEMVPVHRLVWVRDDSGAEVRCTARR